jgi:hypothetical protein
MIMKFSVSEINDVCFALEKASNKMINNDQLEINAPDILSALCQIVTEGAEPEIVAYMTQTINNWKVENEQA